VLCVNSDKEVIDDAQTPVPTGIRAPLPRRRRRRVRLAREQRRAADGTGPASSITRPAFHGYYDGHKDTYVSTDVSDKADARAMHVNYAPVLKSVPLASAPEIYLVQGKAASGQLAIFGSEPGEASYSPIWKETLLSWKANAKPVLIKSDTQVDQLEKKGALTERATSVRLNCPIVAVATH
jgi:hypothetical protein